MHRRGTALPVSIVFPGDGLGGSGTSCVDGGIGGAESTKIGDGDVEHESFETRLWDLREA